MDRDAVLVAALGTAVLAGCTSPSRPRPTPSPTPSRVIPDVGVLREWYVEEQTMLVRYTAASRIPPIAALHDNHLLRAQELADYLDDRFESPPPVPSVAPPRATRAQLFRILAKAERELAARYQASLASVSDEYVAVLGAELAAGARQHAAVLGLIR